MAITARRRFAAAIIMRPKAAAGQPHGQPSAPSQELLLGLKADGNTCSTSDKERAHEGGTAAAAAAPWEGGAVRGHHDGATRLPASHHEEVCGWLAAHGLDRYLPQARAHADCHLPICPSPSLPTLAREGVSMVQVRGRKLVADNAGTLATQVLTAGYDRLIFLRTMCDDEIADLAATAAMPQPHARMLFQALADLRAWPANWPSLPNAAETLAPKQSSPGPAGATRANARAAGAASVVRAIR